MEPFQRSIDDLSRFHKFSDDDLRLFDEADNLLDSFRLESLVNGLLN